MGAIKWFGYFLVTIAIICAGIVYVTLPVYDGVIKVSSKYGKITIYRDDHGIPHLFAENEHASYFGTGYMHAMDRLWILEKFRRLARGTLSEILGDEAYPIDYFLRQFGFVQVSKSALKNVDPELLIDLKIVLEGVNEYIKNNILPIEYYILGIKCEPYTVLDLLSVEKFLDFVVSYNYQMEITRDYVFAATNSSDLADKYMPYQNKYYRHNNYPTIEDEELIKQGLFIKDGMKLASKNYVPSYSKFDVTKSNIFDDVKKTLGMVHYEGSNGWVIHGNHTKSGKPILSSDPHLNNMAPCLWHFAEITYEDKSKNQNVTQVGNFAVGQPWIMMGRAQHISYTITALHGDTIDLYRETLVDDDKFYMFDGHKLPVKQRKEIIKVRNLLTQSGFILKEILINSTHHGPLVNDPYNLVYDFMKRLPYNGLSRKDIAFQWVGFMGISQFFHNSRCLNRAEDVHVAIQCLKNPGTQNINYLIADQKGNIGFTPVVSYPIRKYPFASAYIQDGSTSENDWKGYVPFDELPKVINPKRGYIANANSMITSQNVKYGVGTLMASPARVIRIQELVESQIKSGKKFTAEDIIEMQMDTVDINARVIHASLELIIDKNWDIIMKNIEPEFKLILRDFRKHIHKWDCNYTVNSTQATAFAIWEMEFQISFLSDQIPSRKVRETISNQPDSDCYLMYILEGLENDPKYMDKYCASNFTMFGVDYSTSENKCLMSLAYSAVYSWNLLSKMISKDSNDWRWGSIHRHYYEHIPFSMIPILKSIWHREAEAGGSRRTVNFALYDYYNQDFERKIFIRSNFASNFRASIDMASYAEPEKYPMYMSIDTGSSQSAFSEYYFNMNKVHFSPKGYKMEIGLENAIKNAKHKLELVSKDS